MHERVSVNALCFPGAELPEMAGYWRKLKPRRISFMSPQLGDDLSVAEGIIAEGGYQFESLVHLFFSGHQLDAPEPVWEAERAKLSKVIQAVAALGGRSVYILSGGHGELVWEDAAARFAEGIAPCAAEAEAAGLKLMIEPTSPMYADSHLAHTLRDTVALAEMAGIGVNIDIFAVWAEAGLKETIARAIPRCSLVQVSDYCYGDRSLPARAVPGDGAIPLERIFDWILSAGYRGAFDLELIGPRIDSEGRLQATRRAADKVSQLLERVSRAGA
jgi:sugar phosphate isomerase/epimerase